MSNKRYYMLGLIVLAVIAIWATSGNMLEGLNNEQVMVIEDWYDGDLHWYTTPGTKTQYFGRPTKYDKRITVSYEQKIRFNDGGHATMYGSMQFNTPIDENNLGRIQKDFSTQKALEHDLIERVLRKAIYMTGPLMSSKESYGDRRANLIEYVEDQIQNGVYQTQSKDIKIVDPLTGEEKNAKEVEILKNEDGTFQRQEEAVLTAYGIVASNFVIDKLPYDETVEKQIKAQQEITMEVQTAIAAAKQAQQRTLTVAEEGKANAAKLKWEQEAIKIEAVTEAEKQRDVAKLDADAAAFYKKAKMLRADGDAYFKRETMLADGALEIKTKAIVEIQKNYATAIQNHQGPLVPGIVMGSNGGGVHGTGNSVTDLINLLTIDAAKQLNLDMTIPAGAQTKK